MARRANAVQLSLLEMSLVLGVSKRTIIRWYEWWTNDEFEKPKGLYLPKRTVRGKNGAWFFEQHDVDSLFTFMEKVNTTHRGCMAEYNAARSWGKRGEVILERRGFDVAESKGKL